MAICNASMQSWRSIRFEIAQPMTLREWRSRMAARNTNPVRIRM